MAMRKIINDPENVVDETIEGVLAAFPGHMKRAAGIAKGSGEPNRNKVGTVTDKQVEEIAKTKMPDLNAANIDAAKKIIAGTARSMGLTVEGGINVT